LQLSSGQHLDYSDIFEYAMSSLVQTWAYIRLPTAEAYGTFFMCSRSKSFCGHWLNSNLSPFTMGATLGEQLFILNLSRTLLI
jgi:hypothetical protein